MFVRLQVLVFGMFLLCGRLPGWSQQEPGLPFETASANGRFLLRIDQQSGKCWAELYRGDRQERKLVWRLATDQIGDQHGYRAAPAKALVSNDGRHCVLSFARGGGTNFCDLLLLGPDGRLMRSIPFIQFMSRQQLDAAQGTICGFTWLKDFWLDNRHQSLFVWTLGGDVTDQLRMVDLESGRVGNPADADIRAALQDETVARGTLEWIAVNRLPVPLELVVAVYEDPASSAPLRLAAAEALLSLGDRRGSDLIASAGDSWEVAPYLGELKRKNSTNYTRLDLSDREFLRARASGGDWNAAWRLRELHDRGSLDLLLQSGYIDEALHLGKGATLRPLLASLDSGDVSGHLLELLCRTPCEEAVPHLAAGLAVTQERNHYLKALRYQTGADLGGDARAWQRWSTVPPADDQARAAALIDAGDRAGLLYLGTNHMFSQLDLANPALRTALQKFPRCLLRVEPCDEVEFRGSTLICKQGCHNHLAWDLQSGRVVQETSFEASSFSYAPDRQRLLTRERIWDTASGRPLANLEGYHWLGIFSPDAAFFRVAEPGTIYDSDGQRIRTVPGKVACWLDGHRLAVVEADRVSLVDAATGKSTPLSVDLLPEALEAGDDGLLLSRPGEFQWWSREEAFPLVRVPGFTPLAFARDTVVLGGTDSVRLVDRRGRQRGPQVSGVAGKASLSPDGRWLALYDQEIRLYHLPTLTPGPILRNRNGSPFHSVVFSPDGGRLAAGSADDQTVWELEPKIPAGLRIKMTSNLLLELWTGLSGQQPGELTAVEYAERLRSWRAKVGVWSSWDCSSLLPDDPKFRY